MMQSAYSVTSIRAKNTNASQGLGTNLSVVQSIRNKILGILSSLSKFRMHFTFHSRHEGRWLPLVVVGWPPWLLAFRFLSGNKIPNSFSWRPIFSGTRSLNRLNPLDTSLHWVNSSSHPCIWNLREDTWLWPFSVLNRYLSFPYNYSHGMNS